MNDANDFNQPQPTPHAESAPPPAPEPPTAFCQQCGKPLNSETVRRVGTAVFCEPCLAARIGVPGSVPPGYRPVNAGPQRTVIGWTTSELNAPGPNPGLAALLGLIPGVGAFYNEQYAKGVVHVIVFMVLVSLADNVNGIFGLLVAAWIFYMAIESHHTARARRDGTPLPNPFGLNEIGERLGFGKSWPSGPSVAEVANDAAAAAAEAAARASATYPPQPPPAQPWGSPTDYNPAAAYTPPTQSAYTQPIVDAAYAQAYRDIPYAPVPPYTSANPYDPASYPPPANRFPAGAVVLIGLGIVFLLTTTGIFSGFPAEALVGCILLGIATWVFLHRMTDAGLPLASDGTPAFTLRVLRALKWAIWLAAVGTLNLLDAFHILTWHYSWPLLIILLGVVILIQRTAYQAAYNQAIANPAPAPAPAPTDSSKGAL